MILINSKKVMEDFGRSVYGKPSDAEYDACYRALVALKSLEIYEPGERVLIRSDCNGIVKRLSKKQPRIVPGEKLWNNLAYEALSVNLTTIYVTAHNGDKWNEYCDHLARFGKKI